jgi:hypothetical protein
LPTTYLLNIVAAHHDGMRKHAEKPIANFNTGE